jgi:hypothetical protein
MNRRTIEAVAEAIAQTSGYNIPDSPVHAARNPGALPAFSPTHVRDTNGYRIFSSVLDGLQALMYDVELKMTGKARSKLQPTNTLADFAVAFGQPATAAQAWSKFLRRALCDPSITHKTPLQHFLQEPQ